jgi:hypothetical protein
MMKDVLYLTNHQADMINEDVMKKCTEVLELSGAKLVIVLMPSWGLRSHMMAAHKEAIGKPHSEYVGGTFISSELDESDEKVTETQMLEFMTNVILPLAMKTKALIIVSGANDCSLSRSLAQVACAEQSRLGNKCPFTVVAIACEFEVHYKASLASEKNSLASQICRGTTAWKSRIPIISKFYEHRKSLLKQCDLNPAASTYVILESVDREGRRDIKHMQQFRSLFIQCMTKNLPSIAVQAYHANSIEPAIDMLKRGVPVMLLDCTERSFTNSHHVNTLTKLALRSNAFPKITMSQKNKILNNVDVNGTLSVEGRAVLLDIAEDMLKAKYEVLIADGVYDALNLSAYAFIHAVLTIGSEVKARSNGKTSLHDAISVMRDQERMNSDVQKSHISMDLLKRSVAFILCRLATLDDDSMLALVDKWIKNNPNHELMSSAMKHKEDILSICDANKSKNGMKAYDAEAFLNLMTTPI